MISDNIYQTIFIETDIQSKHILVISTIIKNAQHDVKISSTVHFLFGRF